ncbi:MAG: hypothetical protein SH817_08300 [Leptospira sp.]|nr:hypothetical protein [Leptospira sp.]
MGEIILFQCLQCHYEFTSYDGIGMLSAHKLKICHQCKQLVDVVDKDLYESFYGEKNLNHLSPTRLKLLRSQTYCPICKKFEHLDDWNKLCPKCNTKMNEGIQIGNWD